MAVLHLHNPRRKSIDSAVVSHDDNTALAVQYVVVDEFHDGVARISVQRSGGLIHDQDVGLPDHSPGDGHALLFASAEFHRRKILSSLQANNFQVLGRFVNGFVPILFS